MQSRSRAILSGTLGIAAVLSYWTWEALGYWAMWRPPARRARHAASSVHHSGLTTPSSSSDPYARSAYRRNAERRKRQHIVLDSTPDESRRPVR